MGIIGFIKGVYKRMFSEAAKQRFNAEPTVSGAMANAVTEWMRIYQGIPDWADGDIKTINFAKAICEETARLTTLAIGVNIHGSARADYLQEQVNRMMYPRLRTWTEYGCGGGTVIFKPSGSGIDVVTPDRFLITSCDSNRNITGVVFQDGYQVGKYYYTKLEYHRYEGTGANRVYVISTKTFKSSEEYQIGNEVSIDSTRWAGIEPEVSIAKNNDDAIDKMLFGVFAMPNANNIDLDSPLGMSIFANAIEELKDLDVAYSQNSLEIEDSQTIELIDDTLIQMGGKTGGKINLPRHVHNVFGNGVSEFYQQIDRPLKTDIRKVGINQQLSFIGYKCGYSDGYFVFDQKTGMTTATQVEADDRRTIQLIKDIRDNLQNAIEDTVYALSVIADLYDLAPVGKYKIDYDFGDITYSEDEDRMRNYQLMQAGIIPKWYYLVKFEGMAENEARALVQEADELNASRATLFSEATSGEKKEEKPESKKEDK